MVAEDTNSQNKVRKYILRAVKIAVKVAIICAIYIVFASVLAPFETMIPNLQEMIEAFVIVYVTLMVVSDLASGTIFQHVFSAGKAWFVITYLLFSLHSGILEYTYENVNLMIDARVLLVVAMLFELLVLAKSVMQAIEFVSEKAEPLRV